MLSTTRRKQLAWVLMVLTPAIWSANYIVARSAPDVITPHLLALLRWVVALSLMLPIAIPELIKKYPSWVPEWRDYLLLGALGMWVCGAFVYIGGETTNALNIGLIYALAPVLIAVFSARLFGEQFRGLQLVGFLMALVGMLVVVLKGSPGNLVALEFTRGDLWILTAVLCWTAYSVLMRKKTSVLSNFTRLATITMGGLVVLTPFTIAEVAVMGTPADWGKAAWLVIIAGVLPGFAAFQAYSYLQQELGASRAGMVLYVAPLYVAIIAWWLLGEVPQWYHIVGAALILPGMYLVLRTPNMHR